MSDSSPAQTQNGSSTMNVDSSKNDAPNSEWNYHPHPNQPIVNNPLFEWPLKPLEIFLWLRKSWLSISQHLLILGLSVFTWFYLQPALERCRTFAVDWIAQMYFRNLVIMVLVAGGLHLYFYSYKKQGKKLKFDKRDLNRNNKRFDWSNQVLDNMFWTLASGVTFWTAYEVLMMWAFANDYIQWLSFKDHTVLFVLVIIAIPVWNSFHFYWVHRFLHWPPLFKLAHALHHRNVNVGPWSGLSMHPVEHAIYMSSVLIHFVIASHPIHIFFHMHWLTVAAVTSHTGFESLLIKDKGKLQLGFFHHQLHHRYYECNYGNSEMPWDKWFGSFHDGSAQATQKLREKLRGKVKLT